MWRMCLKIVRGAFSIREWSQNVSAVLKIKKTPADLLSSCMKSSCHTDQQIMKNAILLFTSALLPTQPQMCGSLVNQWEYIYLAKLYPSCAVQWTYQDFIQTIP